MRKLKLFFACLLMAVLSIGQVWAADATCTLTSAQIKAGSGSTSYGAASATDGCGNTWNAYAIKNQHSNATSDYHFWQIKKYASNTAYYIQVPTMPGKITSIVMTVSSSSKAMDGGGNTATLYFSSSNSTSAAGTGVASGTGASSVTIDCSSLEFTSGYITASGAVRVWNVEVTYSTGGALTPTLSLTPNSWDFGTVATTGEASKTFSLTGSNLTAGNLTISVPSGYSVSPSSKSVSAGTLEATEFTVTKNTNTANTYNGNFTIYGGGVTQENAASATLSMTVVDPVDPDITFNNGTVEVGEDLDLSSLFTSNSEGAVTYSIIEGSSYASLSGSVLTGEVIGDVTIQASQAANAGYNAKSVTATINVVAALSKSRLIFTEACGGSGTADDGAAWAVTSDGTESTYDATKGIHYGTNSGEVQYIRLSTSDISGTISKVVVNASTASGVSATVSVTVGGDAFGGEAQSLTSSAAEYTFSGSATGEIVVLITKPSSATKAIYCKSIIVSYEAAPDDPAVTVNPTSVSLATPDAANGTIDATYENIDLANVTVGRYNDAECTDEFTGDWLTATLNGDKDIEYTIAANTGAARTAYIKLTAPASNGTSPAIVKVIPVSQAKAIPTYTSLDAVFAAAGSDETVKIVFDNYVITGKKDANTAYLTDKENMYGLVIFTTGHGFNVGDVLNGTVQTTLCKYQGNSELKGLTSTTDGLSVVAGSPISTPRVVADPTTLSGANTGSVIKVTGSCTKETKNEKDYYYVNGVQLYNALSEYTTPTVGDQYHCTGVFLMYNAIKEIMPREASELKHIDVPTAVISLEDVVIEKGQNTTLEATITPAAAASAEVTYSIVDGGEYISLSDDELTANEIGTAHILATVADNLPNYYGATKQITVTVTAPDSRYKAEQTGFAAIVGNLTTVTEGTHKDKQYISYEAKQGNSSTVPAIYDTDKIRIYQNGGLLVIGAAKGCKIDQVFLTTGGTYNSTTIGYSTSEESIATSGDNVAKNTTWNTATGLNSDTVVIVCLGTDKNSRIDVAKLDVRYTGDPISVKSIALSGEYQTEFTKNATFNHDGVVVTATYTDDSQANVTTLAEFSEPDMSTLGQKTVTVSYGGQSTSYNIDVVAATLTEIAISGTYPTRFNVGDEFSYAGMTVTATYSDYSEEDVTGDATFSGYNMSVGGIQTVTVEYGDQSAQYSIIVVPANTDVITADDLEATNTQYKAFSDVTDLGTSAVYAGKTAKSAAGAIQVRTSADEDGIVVTGQNGEKVVKSVAIDFATVPTSPKVLQVYGKHTAYSSAADLFDDEEKGDLIGTLGEDGSVDCTAANYEFIGIRSSDGAMYLASVMVTWGEAVVPPTVYTVTFNTNGGSTIDPVEVEEGQAVAKPADPTKDDYNFVEWQLSGAAYDFATPVTADITLDAVWAATPAPVTYVAQIGETMYESLPAAVAAAQDGQTVNLLMDVAAGPGVMITTAEHKQIIIDFGNHTYCANSPAVGSAGTQNQAFHFEKGCNITLQNGTITSSGDEIKMLIQNYGDLTLLNITLIGNNLPGTHRYVLSNNCGNVVIGAGTTITAKEGDVAFDVCVTNYYPEGTQVTVEDGATITGIVEYDVWGTKPADNKATLTIEGGNFNITWNVESALAEDAKDNINVEGGTFSAEVPADYCAPGYIPEDNGSGQYGVHYVGYYERGSLTPGNYATICLPNGGKISGASLFDIEYCENSTLYLLEVEGNTMVAGRPYIFLPSVEKIKVIYTDAENATAGTYNGLVGSLSLEAEVITPDDGNYILYNNQYWYVNSLAYVGANRAYIHMDGVPTQPSQQQGAPRRRVAMQVNGQNTTTGVDQITNDQSPITNKVIIDGRLFILRGEKMYNANGQLVK